MSDLIDLPSDDFPGYDVTVVMPVEYHLVEARIAHAHILGELAFNLPENVIRNPVLSGDFVLPTEAVTLTGVDSVLGEAACGEALTLLPSDGVLGMLWYGPEQQVHDGLEMLVEMIQEKLADIEDIEGRVDAQYVIAKWKHPECNRAILGLFGSGEHVQNGMANNLASQAELILLQDDEDPFQAVDVGLGISALGATNDEIVAIFELLMMISDKQDSKDQLGQLMETNHVGAIELQLDESEREDWLDRMNVGA